jgi:nonribosomal peptide synthetase protein VioG
MDADEPSWLGWRAFNSTEVKYASAESLLEMIEVVIAQAPGRPAIQGTDKTLTYAELGAQADRVAAFLRAAGIRPGAVVAITAGTTTHPYAAILGVIKAGCGYLPVDASYPAERLAFMLRDAQAAALLACAKEIPRLAEACPPGVRRAVLDGEPLASQRALPAVNASPGKPGPSVAYVIYTSGTTGQPKGVRISHDALLNFVHWFVGRHTLRAGDRVAQVAPLTFDPSAQQIFPAWATGACLIPVPDAELHDPVSLLEWLSAQRITHLDLVTSHWHQLREAAVALNGECALPDLRWIVIGGETMYYRESHEWYSAVQSPARLNNIYGPTEATINATEWEVERARADGQVPIGVPLPNYRLYVVGRDRRLCAAGETGELVIAGAGLAERYQSAEATARSFGTLVLPDGTTERIYRSGDLARLISDPPGARALEFRGRTDTQVKIRGYRVELEEVEAAVRTCPGISTAAVVARGEPAQQLVCFSTGPRELAPDLIRRHLAARIPDYMIPGLYLWLTDFPVTKNGKLDRAALSAALDARLAARAGRGGGTVGTATERAVAHAWARILDIPEVGLDEDFFGLGGTSLLAAAAVNLLRRQGHRIRVRDLLQAPTPRRLAGRMDAMAGRDDATAS